MLHSPVLRYLKESDEVEIVSLEANTDPTSWMEYIQTDLRLGNVCGDNAQLKTVYNCDVLRLTQKTIETYHFDTPPFSKLAFTVCPISIHPTLATVNLLQARNFDACLWDDRNEIIGMRFNDADTLTSQLVQHHFNLLWADTIHLHRSSREWLATCTTIGARIILLC